MPRNFGPWIVLLALLGALLLLVLFLDHEFPTALRDEDGSLGLVLKVLILVLVGASLVPFILRQPVLALRHAAIWAGVFVLIIFVYSFRGDATALWNRFVAELVPARGVAEGEGIVRIRASADGHVHVRALVNGQPITLIVDTGATAVSLSRSDARRAGFDPDRLDYSQRVRTANGVTRAAPVRIGEIRIGDIVVTDVRGSVAMNDRAFSLLGMSYLDRIGGWSYQDGTLTLRR